MNRSNMASERHIMVLVNLVQKKEKKIETRK
jgi:hypothetical protein